MNLEHGDIIANGMKGIRYSLHFWKYSRKDFTLTHKHYEIDLAEIKTKKELLDVIFHVNEKSWATPEVMQEFLDALQWLLSPQENYIHKKKEPVDVIQILLDNETATENINR